MEASAPSSNIPNEIIRIILLQLPVKSIIRFQCVCKQWRSMIQDSDFKLSYGGKGRLIILSNESERRGSQNSRKLVVRSTTRHGDLRLEREKWPLGEASAYPFIPGSDEYRVRALCSCNGFVLLAAGGRDFLLWNPSTRCSTKVLVSPYPVLKSLGTLAGLCYDSCTRDYKVVLLIRSCRTYFGYKFDNFDNPYVFYASLNHKKWRYVWFPYDFDSAIGSVEFRNTFHWWVNDIEGPYDWGSDYFPADRDRNRIVYFDPVHDKFRILPTPTELSSIVGLGVIDDCLSMACIPHHIEEETKTIQVLIMKEYGRQESWMTAFAIQMPELTVTYGGYGLTFYSQQNNAQEDVLFMRRSSDRQYLYVYDRKKDKVKEVLMDFLKQNTGLGNYASMCFYVESFNCLPLQSHE
nr:F-box/kelch-repeat protein At3g23880-like [Ipomoea batatas]